jgi:hypothetical protein
VLSKQPAPEIDWTIPTVDDQPAQGPPAPARGKAWLIAGVVMSLTVIGVVVWWNHGPNRPGGDPNGRELKVMEGIERAVPPGATQVSHRAADSYWGPACPDIPNAQAGWNNASVYVNFSDLESAPQVTRQVSAVLERQGWIFSPMRITVGQGLVPHWTRSVRGGRPIDAFAYAVPHGSSAWFLTASWQPPGPVDGSCP